MATSVNLPALGESVTEGTVTRWLKQPGDSVAVDEPLLEVSTDKVDTEIPSPVAGTLLEIKVQEDETVEVGAELAVIGDEGESAGSSDGGDQAQATQETEATQPDQTEQTPAKEHQPAPGDESGADGADESGERKTETETNPPAAQTDSAPAQAETPQGSADTAPEQASSNAAGQSGGTGGGSGTPVTLPALGESVTEGTVTRWLKQVGDEVAVDEPLLEVSTDKVDTEIPSPVAGTLLEIKVQEDETVEVGAELAIVGSGDAAPSGGGEPAPAPAEEKAPEPEPEIEMAAADEKQLAAAKEVLLGESGCEFDQKIQVHANAAHPGYVDMSYNKKKYTMKPVLSPTGALRLEDVRSEALMIQIASKTMVMNQKTGQRMVDNCVHPDQRTVSADSGAPALMK